MGMLWIIHVITLLLNYKFNRGKNCRRNPENILDGNWITCCNHQTKSSTVSLNPTTQWFSENVSEVVQNTWW